MSITPNPPADFSPSIVGYSGVQPFRFWCQKVLPLVYDDSLSYYELLNKVVDYLNATISDVATAEDNINSLATAYNQLQSYVNNYFSTLDVQAEINRKLNAMAASGELDALLSPVVARQIGDVVGDQIDDVVANQINSVVADQIDDVVEEQLPSQVATQSPSVITGWLNEHVTPVGSAVIVDNSLSTTGAAADAKVAGDNIRAIYGDVASEFDATVQYKIGDYVIRNKTLYRFSKDHLGDWANNDAIVAPIGTSLKEGRANTEEIINVISYQQNVSWELGNINASTGANSSATNRIRSNYIPYTQYTELGIDEVGKFSLRWYDSENNFVTGFGSDYFTNQNLLVKDRFNSFISSHPSAKKFRIVLAYVGDATIEDISDLSNRLTIKAPVIGSRIDDIENDIYQIASEFSSSSNYAAGDYAIYDGGLYRFDRDHAAGAWNASDVTATTVDKEMKIARGKANDLADYLASNATITWAIGGINASTGENYAADNRARSGYVQLNKFLSVNVPANVKIDIRGYTSANAYVGRTSNWTNDRAFRVYDRYLNYFTAHPEVTKVRFVIAYNDDSVIDDANTLANIFTFYAPDLVDVGDLKDTVDSIAPSSMVFWSPSANGFGPSNKFSPRDMPANCYTYVLGSYFTNFNLYKKSETAGYWIYKFKSLVNSSLIIYLMFTSAEGGAFYVGRTIYNNETIDMARCSYKPTIKIAFFGDSVVRGINSDAGSPGDQSHNAWSEVNIPNLTSTELNCVIDNYGIGGIGWLETASSTKGNALQYLQRMGDPDWYCTPDTYVNNKFVSDVHDWSYYDTVILRFGANDRAAGGVATDLGSIDDIDNTMTYEQVMAMTPTTIVEAMYQCYRYIREQAPTINIIIDDNLVHKQGSAPEWSYPTRYAPSKWSWYELLDMYEDFAKTYGLGHMSHFDAPINRVDPNISLKDNLHPTTACYRQLAKHYAGKISALVL